ncbi:hypothetical protein [Sphaerotilus sp.]|uniref:hypothetical protein n=1 Tax=Sphaerotilus sp. TaxID=2093942 RepID=UPI002ACD54B7|nr:hypothetical protein [Sphaerotilus sp.]MDZ7856784.1 hypothetical protein [Sphaerotilus sp.]
MTEQELAAGKEQLATERFKLEREKSEFEQKKLQRVTIAVSTVAVFVSSLQVGVAFLQSRLAAAQTVEKFIPHLQRTETRDAALLTMSVFTDQSFVTQLAEKLKATAVLETLQTKGSSEEKAQASTALSSLDQRRRALIEGMFSADKSARISATTEVVRQWKGDGKLVPELLEYAATRVSNQSGTINALVVLREMDPEQLKANATELSAWLEKAKQNGPQSAGLVNEVTIRMGSAK